MKVKMKQVGSHRLSMFGDTISLSLNGIIQLAVTGDTTRYNRAVSKLEAYYAKHGTDFLADCSFVSEVLS